MDDEAALRVALDLLHVPSRVRLLRANPLPQGVPFLLLIVAGDQEATAYAAKIVDRTEDMVQKAAAFFIEQILLCPEADSYRVLGASPDATTSDLRRNMALLIKWLHPDLDRPGEQSVFARRVTMAWDDLKTSERRAAYDLRRALPANKASRRKQLAADHASTCPTPCGVSRLGIRSRACCAERCFSCSGGRCTDHAKHRVTGVKAKGQEKALRPKKGVGLERAKHTSSAASRNTFPRLWDRPGLAGGYAKPCRASRNHCARNGTRPAGRRSCGHVESC